MNAKIKDTSPHAFSRRILLLVSGLSPQIVTETVYALTQTQDPAWIPTEVHVLTTVEGQNRAREALLSPGKDWFKRLCQEYAMSGIVFDSDHIHLITDADGAALKDIITESDNQAAADALTRWVAELTADELSALHVSIAGGRKSMGFLAGYTLSLFGRPQDRLSHVLVSPGYESSPEFFYPERNHRPIAAGSKLDAKDARVSLADLPFVRLRTFLGKEVAKKDPQYRRIVEIVSDRVGVPEMIIDCNNQIIKMRGQVVRMPPMPFALYAWLSWRWWQGRDAPTCPIKDHPDSAYSQEMFELFGDLFQESKKTRNFLLNGLSHEQFNEWLSRAHKLIETEIGSVYMEMFRVFGRGMPPVYAPFNIEPHQINFEMICA